MDGRVELLPDVRVEGLHRGISTLEWANAFERLWFEIFEPGRHVLAFPADTSCDAPEVPSEAQSPACAGLLGGELVVSQPFPLHPFPHHRARRRFDHGAIDWRSSEATTFTARQLAHYERMRAAGRVRV